MLDYIPIIIVVILAIIMYVILDNMNKEDK